MKFQTTQLRQLLFARLIRSSGRYILFVLFLSLPVIVVLSMFRKAKLVRFGEIPSRLGHMSADLDTYITLKKSARTNFSNSLDLLCLPDPKSGFNRALIYKLRKELIVLPRFIIVPFLIVINEVGIFKVHRLYLTPERKFTGELNDTIHLLESPVTVSQEESLTVLGEFRKNSIDKNSVVILALRDSLYSSSILDPMSTKTSYRNIDEHQAKTLIEELTKHGYGVVRAGSIANNLESVDKHKFWDYANSDVRSDINDLILFYLGRFCVAADTGLHELAFLNRKPVYLFSIPAFTNKLTSPLLRLVAYCDFFDSVSLEPLGLSEMQKRGVFAATGIEHFQQMGVRPNRMSEDDIARFIEEVHEFERGSWEESKESMEIKCEFLRYLEPYGFKRDSEFKFPNYWSRKSNWLS